MGLSGNGVSKNSASIGSTMLVNLSFFKIIIFGACRKMKVFLHFLGPARGASERQYWGWGLEGERCRVLNE